MHLSFSFGCRARGERWSLFSHASAMFFWLSCQREVITRNLRGNYRTILGCSETAIFFRPPAPPPRLFSQLGGSFREKSASASLQAYHFAAIGCGHGYDDSMTSQGERGSDCAFVWRCSSVQEDFQET